LLMQNEPNLNTWMKNCYINKVSKILECCFSPRVLEFVLTEPEGQEQ